MGSKIWSNASTVGKVFIFVILIEVIILVALTIERLLLPMTPFSQKYAILILFNSIFLFLFSLDGVLNESVFQLLVLNLVSIGVTVTVLYQYFAKIAVETIVLYIRLGSACLFTPINIIFSIFVYRSFNWRLYKKIGASRHMQNIYKTYQQLLSLVKLDFMLGVNLVIVTGFYLFNHLDWTLGIDIGNAVIVVLLLCSVWIGVRREIAAMVIFAIILSPISIAYVGYKGYVFFASPPIGFFMPIFYIMASFYVVVRILMVSWLVMGWRNFDEGLLEIFAKENSADHHVFDKLIDTGVI